MLSSSSVESFKAVDGENLLELIELFKSIKYNIRHDEAEKALCKMDAVLSFKEIQTSKEKKKISVYFFIKLLLKTFTSQNHQDRQNR